MQRLLGCVVLAAVVSLGTGCSTKIGECNALIEEMNKTGDTIAKADTDPNKDAKKAVEGFKSIAATAEKSAETVGNQKIEVAELKEFAKEYQDIIKQIATSAKAAGDVVGQIDKDETKAPELLDKIDKASKDYDAAVDKQSKLVDKINTFCQQ